MITPKPTYRASKEALNQIQTGDLTPVQQQQFQTLVAEYADIFAENQDNLQLEPPSRDKFRRHL
jgi:hypothetical protein